MSFINSFFIPILCKKIGVDQFFNTYYEGKKTDYLGHKKRFVIYKGDAEPSKVPPKWHAWLHHMINEVPTNNVSNFIWQKDYAPNLTGNIKKVKNKAIFAFYKYNAWQPNNKLK